MKYKCQLCGESDIELLHDRGRGGVKVENYICRNCGYTFILPRPSIERHEEQYKKGKFSKEARGSAAPEEGKFKHAESLAYKRFKLLEAALGDQMYTTDHTRIIEIGCGTGSFLRYMKAAGWEVLGLEPDVVFAKAGAERYNIQIQNMFLEEFNSNKQYDMVASFHVIEHVEEVNEFLTKVYSVLKDNGILFIECPTIDHMYGPDKDFFFWDVHINTFSNKTLSSFLIKNGFEILNETVFSGFINIICRKKTPAESYKEQFDNYSRIKNLVNHYAPKQNQRKEVPLLLRAINKAKKKVKSILAKESHRVYNFEDKTKLHIAHLGFHHSTNTGDILLFEALRDLLHFKNNEVTFDLIDLHEKVTEEFISYLNKFDVIIIGGGGLFLKDTNPNNISGWQWACPNELMKKISKPIIVFAVGYNRFRGQGNFHPNFSENVNMLLEKSIFFGIRNSGSITKLNEYVREDLQKKIQYQPCATTIISKFEHKINHNAGADKKVLAVNIAFDRHHLRFQGKESKILWNIADALKQFQDKGWKIVLLVHVNQDIEAEIWFKARGVYFEIVNLVGANKSDIYNAYKKFRIVMGMRCHAQMIPFGLNIPIITLSTHDKMMYFLKDIHHSEWGIELVKSENLTEEISQKVEYIEKHYQEIKLQLKDAQDMLWSTTEHNLENIFSKIQLTKNHEHTIEL